jgi:hypothetical protein
VLLRDELNFMLAARSAESKVLKSLLRLKRHQLMLTRDWIGQNHFFLKELRRRVLPLEIYRMKLLQFINSLEGYCMQTVEREWQGLERRLAEARSLKAAK